MYAEVIFETGANSVLYVENEDELKQFLAEHDGRARTGQPGAAQDQQERPELTAADFAVMPSLDRMKERPAERVHKVLLYDEHPADKFDSRVSSDSVRELVSGMADENGLFDHEQLIRALRDEASPVYPQDQGRLESAYKAEPSSELNLDFLESGDA